MNSPRETVIFGSGCFWCTEAIFKTLKGVKSVMSGYAGGHTENPTYDDVAHKNTGHAEVVKVVFDPTIITFRNLLTVFFATHDATQINRQGHDIGSQYRSLILYTNDAQKKESEDFINELNHSAQNGDLIATQVASLSRFYPAEQEHLDYYEHNKSQRYCQLIIAPKLQKVQKEFADLLRKNETLPH